MSKLQLVTGYGPYRVDEHGVPFLNDVVWDFLGKRDISAEEFGNKLGRLTRPNHKPYTKGRIYQMLQDNSFSDEKPRRWVIAKLLQIPPTLMGVKSLDDLLIPTKHKPKPPIIQTYQTIPQEFDIKEYRHSLQGYWQTNYTNTAREGLDEIEQRISFLEQEGLYGRWTRKENIQLLRLLCEYHMIFAHIARDQEYYDTAILHLNNAYQLAKNYALIDTQAAILCRRGEVFNEQGYACENRLDLDSARKHFTLAQSDFLAAKELEKKLYASLRGRIQLNFGLTSSHLAFTPSQLHQAIVATQKAEDFVGQEANIEDIYFVMLDEERYHLDLASVYINAPIDIAWYPRDARRELRNALAASTTPTSKRRQAFETILTAKSYLIEKEYEEATKQFLEALSQAQAINSKVLIARIVAACNTLLATEYGERSVDVAELEVSLMGVERPELFQ